MADQVTLSLETQSGPRILVVHGPFGSGKSTLLVALGLLFTRLRSASSANGRVLVAAHTNAAVDGC